MRRRDAMDNIFTLQLNIRSNYSNDKAKQYKKFVTQTQHIDYIPSRNYKQYDQVYDSRLKT